MNDDQNQTPLEEDVQESIPDNAPPSGEGSGDSSPETSSQGGGEDSHAFYHKTIARLKRDMLRAQREAMDLKEKLKVSETLSSQMSQSALESFKANALTLMEKARTAKKHAHELSDIDGIVAADEELAKAAAQLQWANTVRIPETQSPSNLEPSQPDDDREGEPHPATQAWIRQNPWINEQSPLFQGEKASAVVSYATALEQQMMAQGRGHEINTPSYFKELDAWVRYWDGQHGGHKTMKNVTTVASTKSASTEGSSKKDGALSEEEKEVCRMMGISEAGYVKQKKALALERAQGHAE
jgi:hypothetical protein